MNSSDIINAHLRYQVPAVRHLAWMCHAPQLITSPIGFSPGQHVTAETTERLTAWDKNPENGPDLLTEAPPRRLGQYFERLYQCLLEDLLGWEVLLKNQPIRNNGLTLGELDFIVRNPLDQTIEHHEIAVKFYLGYLEPDQPSPLWYGPNASDRLDIKTERLLSHQCRLAEFKETRARLSELGIPVPDQARAFMPGYLFYPSSSEMQPPERVPESHLRGEWMYIDQLSDRQLGQCAGSDETAWVPLRKPHWLGPWIQKQRPDQQDTEQALSAVRATSTPRLFAVMKQTPDQQKWQEITRIFVVPHNWPRQ